MQVKEVLDMSNKDLQLLNVAEVEGGVGGMGKMARGHLRDIKRGKATFGDKFNTENGEFIIARKEGKRQYKTAMYRLVHWTFIHKKCM